MRQDCLQGSGGKLSGLLVIGFPQSVEINRINKKKT